MKLHLTAALLAAAAALSGCQPKAAAPVVGHAAFDSLAGTSWRLVEFQSMDDAQGTSRPKDPARYTLRFEPGGRLTAQLDCNRGVGSWKNEISNATGGSLAFGPLATTKMLCPPPSMGELVGTQLNYVRSFTVRDGKLFMSLMADGGTIVWERNDAAN